MSAETLRKAAALMRKRAEAATDGPLIVDSLENGEHGLFIEHDRDLEAEALGCGGWQVAGWLTESNAAHFAAWDPAVALAVADWLDRAADEPWCCDECKFDPSNDMNLAHNALAVARAYLGGAS